MTWEVRWEGSANVDDGTAQVDLALFRFRAVDVHTSLGISLELS